MRPVVLIIPALFGACVAEPATIQLDAELPTTVYSFSAIPLPNAVAQSREGEPLASPVEVSVDPPGRVQVASGVLIPHVAGTVTVKWTAGKATRSSILEVRPVDKVELSCLPGCDLRVGEKMRIMSTAFAGTEALLELEIPLKLDAKDAVLEGNVLTAKVATEGVVRASVGDVTGEVQVRFHAKADRVSLHCPTVFTISKIDGEDFPVCHLTRLMPAKVKVRTFAGENELTTERITLTVLDERLATVTGDGQLTAINKGRTSLRASLEDNAFVSDQLGLDIELPNASYRLFRSNRRQYGRRTSTRYRNYYAQACAGVRAFTAKAFVNIPEQDEAEELFCEGAGAVACVAEASSKAWLRGKMDESAMREWLGPCCCVTKADRALLQAEGAQP